MTVCPHPESSPHWLMPQCSWNSNWLFACTVLLQRRLEKIMYEPGTVKCPVTKILVRRKIWSGRSFPDLTLPYLDITLVPRHSLIDISSPEQILTQILILTAWERGTTIFFRTKIPVTAHLVIRCMAYIVSIYSIMAL